MLEDIFVALKTDYRAVPEEDRQIQRDGAMQFAIKHRLNFELDLHRLKSSDWENPQRAIIDCQAFLKDFSGLLSIHGPVADLNPVSPDEGIAELSTRRIIQAIELSNALSANYLVLHSLYSPIFPVIGKTKRWINKMTEFWEALVETHLQQGSLTLLLENTMDDSPEYLKTIVSRVNSPNFKVCLDTGHVNLFSKVALSEWLSELGTDVVYVHANNNNGETDEHVSFADGNIDMPSFLNYLTLLNHKTHLAIEVTTLADLKQSYDMVVPYQKIQAEQFASKSFLV